MKSAADIHYSVNLLYQVIEQSGVFQADGLQFGDMPSVISTAVGQMVHSCLDTRNVLIFSLCAFFLL